MQNTPDEQPPNFPPVIRVLAMPKDTNSAGDIFGGWIMSQVDIAGSVLAHEVARGRVVTVAVNSFVFHRPVFVGDLISCYAELTRIGNTSLTIDVKVFADRMRLQGNAVKVTEAQLTYVAVDEERRPRPVPKPGVMV